MKFNVITLFPDLFAPFFEGGVIGRALKKGLFQVDLINPRSFAEGVHQAVDDRPYGGGDGMIMFAEVLRKSILDLESKNSLGKVIYMSPHGEVWNNSLAKAWAQGLEGFKGAIKNPVVPSGDLGKIEAGSLREGGKRADVEPVVVRDSLGVKKGLLGTEQISLENQISIGNSVEQMKDRELFVKKDNSDWGREQSGFNGVEFLTIICGRYGGIDQRFIKKYVDKEISVGDFVVSGGELPAMILIDSVVRFLPGVLGNEDSPYKESFGDDGLLEAPQFTRPAQFEKMEVPKVLLSGDHKKIEDWRRKVGLLKTALLRPDLIENGELKLELKQVLSWAKKQDQDELSICGVDVKKISESFAVGKYE